MLRYLIIFALAIACVSGSAQVNFISYEGRLMNQNGRPLAAGQHVLEINIFSDAHVPTPVWGPFFLDGDTKTGHVEYAGVSTDGRFNVILGPADVFGRPLSQAFGHTGSEKRFIQLRVDGGAPILPLQQILGVPYAYRATRLPNVISDLYGNIGVDVTTPTAKLDIAGNVKTNGTLSAANGAFGTAAIGTAMISESGGTLNVGSPVKVSGDVEVTGNIKNFAVNFTNQAQFQPEVISTGQSSIRTETQTIDTGLPASNWFCMLSAVKRYNHNVYELFRDITLYNDAQVMVQNGKWYISAACKNSGGTVVGVSCFKYK